MRKDEDLEILRKNIKQSKWQEYEIEMQQYREEALRLRALLENLMQEGGMHPAFQ